MNIKKGQFLAPWDISATVEKAQVAGAAAVLVTERGTTFGYNQVVVDMRNLVYLKLIHQRIIFDATHSTQLSPYAIENFPKEAEFIAPLARAAAAIGADGIFFETHPRPAEALSDGSRALPLSQANVLLHSVARILEAVSDSNWKSADDGC